MLPPPTPGAFQCTSLSSLDTLPPESRQNTQLTLSSRGACVREMRRKLVDPALAHAAEFLATFPPDSDDECARPVRAKGAARGARDARVKSARKARVKDMRSNSKRSKATNRKKSDAAAASASVRPRGHGGRFRKLDQIVKDTSAQHAQAAGTSASAVSAFTPTTLTPGPLTLTHQRRFPSDSPSTVGLDEDPLLLEGGRGQRMRRPSTRLGSPTPSVMSAVSSATGSGRGKGKARASPTFPASHWRSSTSVSTSASPAPEGAPRVRLTIRIPPRATLTYSAPEGTGARGYADGHASATTSLGTSVSTSTGMSISTGSGSATATGERRSYSPATTMRSASVVRFVSVKQEDEGDEKFMDVDQNIERDPGALDNCADMGHVLHEAKPEHHAHPGLEEGAYSDSDDSFICEVVPPPSAVTGSSTVTAPGAYRNELSGSNKAMIRNGSTRVNTGADLSSPSRHGKDKSTTFNQTWSDEEQRLLDILLEQFPDGTKNRYVNSSTPSDICCYARSLPFFVLAD
ncbi:hypothetical protein EW145_g6413 [Phellinidium pouzarii]|uniref:Uncharacterized protein n=1 Tax=Phellinidium pouzarii TaxID=167371 RepID=A0A4S4L1D4_9AGAM|nr:hypothetical protein EW145_g6413 [Phellinidium pouzarii]